MPDTSVTTKAAHPTAKADPLAAVKDALARSDKAEADLVKAVRAAYAGGLTIAQIAAPTRIAPATTGHYIAGT